MVSKNKTLMQYSVNATIYQVLVNRFQHINIKKQIYIFNHADLARNRWILQERLSWMQIAHARERGRKSEKESIRKENIDGISYWLWPPTINSGWFFRPAFGFHDQLYWVCCDSDLFRMIQRWGQFSNFIVLMELLLSKESR
jgi:hypothetical protein